MLLYLSANRASLQGETPRQVELKLFVKSSKNNMLYIENCTEFLYIQEGHDRVAELKHVHEEEKNVASMFEAEKTNITDGRNALSRCGKCKSTNVQNVARQVRSADEGMSVFSTCLECGETWVQR